MTRLSAPRVVVSGLSGDSGKTLVALALLVGARERGVTVRAFKKGPDYIDAAWGTWASGAPARNLDTFLAGPEHVAESFARHAARAAGAAALNVIEGNRGLFDGTDPRGTHSTAALAKLLGAPVVLVISARKMAATAAALVRGCQVMDPKLSIAGVVLNQMGSDRHAAVAREAIEDACGVPVLGVIPRLRNQSVLPGRHLGLVPPAEHGGIAQAANTLRAIAREHLDMDRILAAAAAAPPIDSPSTVGRGFPGLTSPSGVVGSGVEGSPVHGSPADAGLKARATELAIGYVFDSAFSFYYPENLEALEARGARLVALSSIACQEFPGELSALYIGGGFPETHGAAISANRAFLDTLRACADRGLPMYAECGGLMLLADGVSWQGKRHAMAGVLPFEVEVLDTPQGHGYVVLVVDRPNPFFPVGLEIRAHEFHYSRIAGAAPDGVCALVRGTGFGNGRDAIVVNQVWASYAHVQAAGLPSWADGLIRAARNYQRKAGRAT